MRILLPLLLAALLPACATITSGASQNVSVETEPPGATCQLQRDGTSLGTVTPTPGTVNISKSARNIAVTCARPGHLPAAQTVKSEFQAATAGNILIGGLIGVAVDAASGAMNRYPDTIRLVLPPDSFQSEAERDAYFAARAEETRQRYAEQVRQANTTCGTVGREVCATRIAAIEAERDAELAQ